MVDSTKELELVWAKDWMMELELRERIQFVNGVTLELGRNKNECDLSRCKTEF